MGHVLLFQSKVGFPGDRGVVDFERGPYLYRVLGAVKMNRFYDISDFFFPNSGRPNDSCVAYYYIDRLAVDARDTHTYNSKTKLRDIVHVAAWKAPSCAARTVSSQEKNSTAVPSSSVCPLD